MSGVSNSVPVVRVAAIGFAQEEGAGRKYTSPTKWERSRGGATRVRVIRSVRPSPGELRSPTSPRIAGRGVRFVAIVVGIYGPVRRASAWRGRDAANFAVLHFNTVGAFRLPRTQRPHDGLHHHFCSHQDIIVPEANDAPALLPQHDVASNISCRRVVSPAIGLDHQMMLRTGEVNDKRWDWVLAAEFAAGDATITQQVPKQALGTGGIATEVARASGRHDHMMVTRR